MGHPKRKVICIVCGTEFETSVDTYNRQMKKECPEFRCRKCYGLWCKSRNKNRWKSLSKEEQSRFRKKMRGLYDAKSDEEKKINDDRLRNYKNNLSDEEKKMYNMKIAESMKRWYSTTPAYIKNQRNQHIKEYWDSLQNDMKIKRIHKSFSNSSKHNKFNIKFEECFNMRDLSNNFYYVREYNSSNNEYQHSWDYGIFNENGELVAVVDLDGAYFHADICDYDGIHSKIEYDSIRSLSVPSYASICIIYEFKFDKSFDMLNQILGMNMNNYKKYLFNAYRSQPFPYPSYTDIELLRSYDALQRMNPTDKYHQSLSLNTRLGDRLIYHFHHSIWDDNGIVKIWNDDEHLRFMIEDHQLYHTDLNKNKILQCVCRDLSFISAGKIRMIISRYLSKYVEIFNPDNKYSNIMLGSITSGKRYYGIEKDSIKMNEYNSFINFLRKHRIKFDSVLNSNRRKFQSMLTEVHSDEEIDENLYRYECSIYLFITSNTIKYQNKIIDSIGYNYYIIKIEEAF